MQTNVDEREAEMCKKIKTRERILKVFLFSDFENVYEREKIKSENKGIFVQNYFSWLKNNVS